MISAKLIVLVGALIFGASSSDDDDLKNAIIDQIVAVLSDTLIITGQCNPPQYNETNFLLYTRSNPNNSIWLDPDNPVEVDPNKKVIIQIHGYLGSANTFYMPELKNAYLQRYDCNLIIVDWSQLAAQLLTTCFCELPMIAEIVGEFLCNLSDQLNIPLNSIHLVGHSLGGQMSGLIGQYTQETRQESIGRITALDPAGLYYQPLTEPYRLDRLDALFVDVVHSNGGQFGYLNDCGDVDFYPNGGTRQSPCPVSEIVDMENLDLEYILSVAACDHIMSLPYWEEGINSDNFKARSSILCPPICLPELNPTYITMGENCPTNAPKKSYWLPTNLVSPYAKGCSPYPLLSGCT